MSDAAQGTTPPATPRAGEPPEASATGSAGVPVRDIADFLAGIGAELVGDLSGAVHGPVSLAAPAGGHGLAFCEGETTTDPTVAGRVRVLLAEPAAVMRLGTMPGTLLAACASPRLAFVRTVDRFWPETPLGDGPARPGQGPVHPSAMVDSTARLAPGVSVGPGCRVGPGAVLHAGVRLYRGVSVGARARIDANAVIGSPGFGFVADGAGGWRRFPQRAAVVIGDDVEIGAGACIDRGALDDTTIGDGTKIDNLAYVAHNVRIGRDCLVMASCVLAGSVVLEDGVVLSPGAIVRDHCTVGRGAHVGMGAVVVADVAPGVTVMGVPAAPVDARQEKD